VVNEEKDKNCKVKIKTLKFGKILDRIT